MRRMPNANGVGFESGKVVEGEPSCSTTVSCRAERLSAREQPRGNSLVLEDYTSKASTGKISLVDLILPGLSRRCFSSAEYSLASGGVVSRR